MNDLYDLLIPSERVSSQTRNILLQRAAEDDPDYSPKILDRDQLQTLRAVAARVIPQDVQDGSTPINLAARLDRKLATESGDGWRYASLPADREAYCTALTLLDEIAKDAHGSSYRELSSVLQDALLMDIAAGDRKRTELDLSRWFEDLRADLTKIFVAHPCTLARMNYSGIADDPNGFVHLGIGRLEDWEQR